MQLRQPSRLRATRPALPCARSPLSQDDPAQVCGRSPGHRNLAGSRHRRLRRASRPTAASDCPPTPLPEHRSTR
jgi:hypothetical protein